MCPPYFVLMEKVTTNTKKSGGEVGDSLYLKRKKVRNFLKPPA